MLESFKSTSETYVSPPVLLDIGDDDPGDLLTVQDKVSSPEIVTYLSDIFFLGQTIGVILPILK